MTDLFQIHNFLDFVMDKEIGGYSTPAEKDMALANASQATFEQYLPYYAETQKFQDALAPFKRIYVFTNSTSPNGIVTLPSNYRRLNSLSVIGYDNVKLATDSREVAAINDDDIEERKRSQLDPVTISRPIFQWIGVGQIQLIPEKPNAGKCVYLKSPDDPHLVFTQTGRVQTYNQSASVQLEWSRGELNNVMFRALQYLGVNMSQEKMIQYTQLKLQDA